jgi:PAS domain S-box-containing protein
MKEPSRTNTELIKEISALKQKIKELEQSESERKRVSGELRQSDEYFKAIIKNSSDIILVVDKLGTITYASPSIERFLGYGPDELIGKRTLDLIVSDDKPRAIADFGRALMTKEVLIPNVFCIRHKDGTERILEGIGKNLLDNPIVAGLVMNVRDITDRKRIEEALRESEELFRSYLEYAPDGVYMSDLEGNFLYGNRKCEEITSYRREELIGKNFLELNILSENSLNKAAQLLQANMEGKPTGPDEIELISKEGRLIPVEINTNVVQRMGQRIVLAFVRDITERKQAEKQLQDTLESLRKAVGVTMQVMVSAVEVRDPYTSGHQTRSADLARAIAIEMGLPKEKIEGIRMVGSIHDIGKLSIPAEILSKPTKLSETEFALIKEHAYKGFEMLKDVESPWPLAEIVYQHHERMDGSGYPRNLQGEEILIEARILAVADVVEAMASHRPYRPGLGIDAALNEIEKNRGIFYDNTVVDACLRLFYEKGFQLART